MSRKKKEYEVENQFIKRLEEMGYEKVEIRNYNDLLKNFKTQFEKLNTEKLIEAKGENNLSESEFERILIRLRGHTIYESAKILREDFILELDNGKRVYTRFLTDDHTKNTFQVAHQITMNRDELSEVEYENRYDVTLLINGLPLVQIELKAPGVEINQAINQINRYRRGSFKGLFRYIQLFIVSNGAQTKYFANTNERAEDGSVQDILKSLVFYWTDESNERINTLIDFTNSFLNHYHLTEMLTRYFVIKETEPVLMVLRPYQYYAVKNAYNRVTVSHKSGFCFHCTGSGKTLTSFKLASLLRENRQIEKIFFLIDRKDLDDQTVDEYNSFEKGSVDPTTNTGTLVKSLKDSSKDLIVTTIQKMSRAIKNEKNRELFKSYENKRVVFIIDECHRSQIGTMHADIKRVFKNADFIGFTGTPIFKENAKPNSPTTADVFATGSDKMRPCFHRYMIKEAIADGNVLRFSVEYMKSLAARKVSIQGLDSEKLDDPEYLKENNIDSKEIFHNPARINVIAEDIIENLDKHIRPMGKDRYTALFAVDSIEMLKLYYKALKKHNDKGYKIAAIFTYGANEEADAGKQISQETMKEIMDDYNETFGTSFDLPDFEAYRKDVSKRMKQTKEPELDLLLVVDMFLTGWDSKPTNTLILDKTLVWHNLLQAYSRTNRVGKRTKSFGQIITYRDIKEAQDDALRLFSGDGNPDDFLMQSYEYFVCQYRKNVEALREVAPNADSAGRLQSEDDQAEYVKAFRKLAGTLSILKTFSKFDWDDLDLFMDEEEYADYHSWYFDYYYKAKRDNDNNRTSILNDLDFAVELLRTDRINVVYILNLLKDLNEKDPQAKREGIDLILREIERSDNEKVRLKTEILKEFITERFFDLEPDTDIFELFSEFEEEVQERWIREYAEENGVPEDIVEEIVTKYQINPQKVNQESIREMIKPLGLGLKKTVQTIRGLKDFSRHAYDVFTAEGV